MVDDGKITSSAAVRRLFGALADAPHETIGFAYLCPEWSLLGTRYSHGDCDTADLPFHEVARDAIRFDAAHVVMAHNHPSGDPSPSRADIAVTRQLASVLDAIGVGLAEHLVLARGGATSLRERGLL